MHGSIEDYSEYWQEQCQQLYNSIARNLPEGSIKLSELESEKREKVDLVTVFSVLAAFGITREVFVNVILDSIKTWLEYRPTAEIELKCPDVSTVEITKFPLARLPKFLKIIHNYQFVND